MKGGQRPGRSALCLGEGLRDPVRAEVIADGDTGTDGRAGDTREVARLGPRGQGEDARPRGGGKEAGFFAKITFFIGSSPYERNLSPVTKDAS